ncbi:molybdenum cofactor biosynthesis protein MoaE [Luteimonas vadosa]|uniref:Molybdopterin synthase catalytic subunit n=1 Tax=Luteimonas vadosa TaxID=1165507 RepID=A0ABP9DWZ9_9GAMM
MSEGTPLFRIASGPIDIGPLQARLANPRAGACTVFEGRVRAHHDGRSVSGLFYEAYVPLAESEGTRIVADAIARHGCIAACCVHRIGDLGIGELAVWVGVSAAHRGAAFDACREIIDEVKARVPIWKRERYVEGDACWQHPVGDVP